MSAVDDASVRPKFPGARQSLFLRVPPFPGSRFNEFTRLPGVVDKPVSLAACIALICEQRVGGKYWGKRPDLPPTYLLIRSTAALKFCSTLDEADVDPLIWLDASLPEPLACLTVVGEFDPWHMLRGARALVCDDDDEVRLVAAILDIPAYIADPCGGQPRRCTETVDALLAAALSTDGRYANPFGGEGLDLLGVIGLCGFWRSMIDRNRLISCGVGFAFWKQDSVLPLLWNGGDSRGFFRKSIGEGADGVVAIWRSKASPDVIEKLDRSGTPLAEVEDGFLRSQGLGADCIPPLSITVDHLGPYFDPAQPSELERLLEHGDFGQALVSRAALLREAIVAAGLGKYDSGGATLKRFDATKRHILVAGQVEDDRSIIAGGAGLATNRELLQRVREREADAYLIYKPHPDVVAGHRKGNIPEQICRKFADKVVTDVSISSLIAMVDEVHVNTSLAGFEALMRHKDVTTYGVPFYAGWGLTHDLGPVPARRTSKRTLDELVAATLLLYPRYLDPLSGLPCPAEVVVDRLCAGGSPRSGLLVAARRIQGKLRRQLQRFAR